MDIRNIWDFLGTVMIHYNTCDAYRRCVVQGRVAETISQLRIFLVLINLVLFLMKHFKVKTLSHRLIQSQDPRPLPSKINPTFKSSRAQALIITHVRVEFYNSGESLILFYLGRYQILQESSMLQYT
jgi:hypothetical protein